MCRRLEPPSIDNVHYLANSPLDCFSELPTFGIFWWYDPNEIRNEHKNKLMRESYFFMFGRVTNNVKCFFIVNTYKQHQAEIRFELKVISGIERSLKKNKHFKWKISRVKSIIASKSLHYQGKTVLTTPTSLYRLLLPFLQENL